MQLVDDTTIKACPVCNQPFAPSARFAFDIVEAPRHHTCSQEALVSALRQRAEARGCDPMHLFTVRLAEMQRQVIRALGEVSFQQFYNPGPEGYVALRLEEKGFRIFVEVRAALLPGTIYHEALITPGLLQQRKAEILAHVLDEALRQGTAISAAQADSELIAHLRHGPDHWDGRKKGDISLEILRSGGVSMKALSLVEMDPELVSAAFAACGPRLQQLAEDTLVSLKLPSAIQPKI